ncbi:MAG: cytochrome C [Deltaproteobacteria bacterium]|nr:cytochrome C [Deltaproteobacteria bacterium]
MVKEKKMVGILFLAGFFFAVFSLNFISGPSAVNAATGKIIVGNKKCIDCHGKMRKDKYVHGVVAVAQCTICHVKTGEHTFKPLPRQISILCFRCHDKSHFVSKKYVHFVVKLGLCTQCHNPHHSKHKFLLRKKQPDLCFKCHGRKMVANKKFIHGPVAFGKCTICHNPHQSNFPKMLMAKGNNVCFTCHTDKAVGIKTAKFVHKPVKQSCVNCHSPHATNYRYQLIADGSKTLCLKCHTKKKKWIAKVKTKHGALATKKGCLACHDPHYSDYPYQLRKQPMTLCLGCHDKRIKATDGTMLPNMKEYFANNKDRHGPIKQKDCTACHNPHGSNNFRILRRYFPPTFYAPFAVKNYALCFMCHEKTLVLNPKTTTLTGFRNGSQNLHYVHVNRHKGRTCIACHEPHATNNPFHIRNSVPFGTWSLPIGFKETKNGGSCSPGCHVTRYFNRIKAVKNR